MAEETFDAIVVGTGFAGAVTACRLVEAGFRVCVLERGRRYGRNDFPRYPTEDLLVTPAGDDDATTAPPDVSRWLWSRDHGLFDIRDLDDVVSIQAAGYGGGSLIYANVHLRPPRDVFDHDWPEEYRNGALEPYFDLAAYMLQAQPIPHRLAKTVQLKEGAEAVAARQAGPPPNGFFRVPLAVNFGSRREDLAPDGDDLLGERENAFGVLQQTCDMRGRCCVGCDRDAKNTLDKNYLARIEQQHADTDGRFAPDIRTLAEVTRIEPISNGFRVHFNNHQLPLTDGAGARTPSPESITGAYVFLCAGAVNTTELLFRSAPAWDTRPGLTQGATPLGSHYFPNADSLAVAFHCRQPHEADYGPTITGAILHDHEADERDSFSWSLDFRSGFARDDNSLPRAGMHVRGKSSKACARLTYAPILDWGNWQSGAAGTLVVEPQPSADGFRAGESIEIENGATAVLRAGMRRHRHWFLIQDGGYPPDLEPLVGIFRSPLLVRRNRFLEPLSADADAVHRSLTPLRTPTRRLNVSALTNAISGQVAGDMKPSAIAGLNVATAPGATLQATHAALTAAPATGRPLSTVIDLPIADLLPQWFMAALGQDRQALLTQAAALALPMVGHLLDEMSVAVARRLDEGSFAHLHIPSQAKNVDKEMLIRGMLRQTLQVLAGGESDVAATIARQVLGPLSASPRSLLDLLGDIVLWALNYRALDGNTGVVLTMGRDVYRGRLVFNRKKKNKTSGDSRLRAKLPGRVLDGAGATQERALRELAAHGWGAELRVNPAWSAFNRRLTVHSQGGCPMGMSADDSVTNAHGEVHDCPGIFVMDAAAFPSSVGVNPSATIAAVAEYKIARFIQRERRDRDVARRDRELAREWVQRIGADNLDPLNRPAPRPAAPAPPGALILGLTFREQMSGFYVPLDNTTAIDFNDLRALPDQRHLFVDAEAEGMGRNLSLDVCLDVNIRDLGRVVTADAAAEPESVSARGTIKFGDIADRTIRDGTMRIFVAPTPPATPPAKFFCYDLPFDGGRLIGVKVLRNDPGQDVWLDTSTLYFEITGDLLRRGILRVPFVTFMTEQVRSMKVTGTSDQARCSWGLTAFAKYFARQLTDIYFDRAEAYTRLLYSALTSIHV